MWFGLRKPVAHVHQTHTHWEVGMQMCPPVFSCQSRLKIMRAGHIAVFATKLAPGRPLLALSLPTESTLPSRSSMRPPARETFVAALDFLLRHQHDRFHHRLRTLRKKHLDAIPGVSFSKLCSFVHDADRDLRIAGISDSRSPTHPKLFAANFHIATS